MHAGTLCCLNTVINEISTSRTGGGHWVAVMAYSPYQSGSQYQQVKIPLISADSAWIQPPTNDPVIVAGIHAIILLLAHHLANNISTLPCNYLLPVHSRPYTTPPMNPSVAILPVQRTEERDTSRIYISHNLPSYTKSEVSFSLG